MLGLEKTSKRRVRKTAAICCAMFGLVLAALGIWAPTGHSISVRVLLFDRCIEIRTQRSTVGQLLTELGLVVGDTDTVEVSPDEPLVDGMTVSVVRGRPVFIKVDGTTRAVLSPARAVEEVLRQAGISLGPEDFTRPASGEPVPEDRCISVVRVSYREEKETREIDCGPPDYVSDPRLDAGITVTRIAGQNGLEEVTYKVRYEDDVAVSREVLARRVVKAPVRGLVAKGTNTEVSREGRTIRFVRAIEVVATAYCPCEVCCGPGADGYTYTGVPAKKGVIAVDPRVIPLGTRVYVDGYGFAVAADIGSAIKGNRIDVCFDAHQEAWRWGVKRTKVYLLAE